MSVDIDKIAKGLNAVHVKSLKARSGYFGALQNAVEINKEEWQSDLMRHPGKVCPKGFEGLNPSSSSKRKNNMLSKILCFIGFHQPNLERHKFGIYEWSCEQCSKSWLTQE